MTRSAVVLAIGLSLLLACDDEAETPATTGAAGTTDPSVAEEPAAEEPEAAPDELTVRHGDRTLSVGAVLATVLELPFGSVAQIKLFEREIGCGGIEAYVAGNSGWRLETSIPGEFQPNGWELSTDEAALVYYTASGVTMNEVQGAARHVAITEMTDDTVSGELQLESGSFSARGPFTATRCDLD